MPIFHRDSFPPGEAKNSETIRFYRSTGHCVAWASGRQVGDPYSRRCKTGCDCHSSDCTPSVSFAASSPRGGAEAASPLREAKSLPYGCGENRERIPFNAAHSLRQPVRAASSLREGAKGASHQRERREAKSLPYGCGRSQGGDTQTPKTHSLIFSDAA